MGRESGDDPRCLKGPFCISLRDYSLMNGSMDYGKLPLVTEEILVGTALNGVRLNF